jgi:hypothetical protein
MPHQVHSILLHAMSGFERPAYEPNSNDREYSHHSATSSTTGSPACVPSLPWQCSCVDASPGGCTDVSSQDEYALLPGPWNVGIIRSPLRAFALPTNHVDLLEAAHISATRSIGVAP